MQNTFFDNLILLTSYSKKDIQVHILIALFISVLFIITFSLLLRGKYNKNKNQFICCGFLISVIYNFLTPFVRIGTNSYYVSIIVSALMALLILSILLFLEAIILYPILAENVFFKKHLILQGVMLLFIPVIVKVIMLFLIVIVS